MEGEFKELNPWNAKEFDNKGNLVLEYKNGKINGTLIIWDDNGVKKSEQFYKNGKLIR